jgi:hypothetical protein
VSISSLQAEECAADFAAAGIQLLGESSSVIIKDADNPCGPFKEGKPEPKKKCAD